MLYPVFIFFIFVQREAMSLRPRVPVNYKIKLITLLYMFKKLRISRLTKFPNQG